MKEELAGNFLQAFLEFEPLKPCVSKDIMWLTTRPLQSLILSGLERIKTARLFSCRVNPILA